LRVGFGEREHAFDDFVIAALVQLSKLAILSQCVEQLISTRIFQTDYRNHLSAANQRVAKRDEESIDSLDRFVRRIGSRVRVSQAARR